MSMKQPNKKLNYFLTIALLFVVMVGFLSLRDPKPVLAAPGDIRVTVTREGDGAAMDGVLVEVKCAGGVYTPFDGSPLTDGSGQVTAAPPAAADCNSDDETMNARVSKAGYETTDNEGGAIQSWSSAADPNEITMSDIRFGLAIIVTDQLGTALDSFDTFTFKDLPYSLQDSGQSNKFYWEDTTSASGTLSIQKDGYVAAETTHNGFTNISPSEFGGQTLITFGGVGNSPCNMGIGDGDFSCLGLEFGYEYTGITNELGGALSSVTLTAGAANVSCAESAGSWYCPIPLGDPGSNNYNASKDGYVTKVVNAGGAGVDDRVAHTDAQVNRGVLGALMQFSHKVIVKDELNTALTPSNATAGINSTVCTVNGSSVYCPVPVADDDTLTNGFVVVKNGYVSTSAAAVPLAANRITLAAAQAVTTMTGANGLKFSHKFNIVDELGNPLTVTSATAGLLSTACTISSSAAYCPISTTHDNNVSDGLVAVKDGYVTTNAADVPLAASRIIGTDPQAVTTLTTANGLDFAVKATVTAATTGVAIDSAAVTTGDSLGVTCNAVGFGNVYYCLVPLAHTETTINVVRSGFNSTTNTFTDRTAHTDAQRAVAISMTPTTVSSGGGGSTPVWLIPQQNTQPIVTPPAENNNSNTVDTPVISETEKPSVIDSIVNVIRRWLGYILFANEDRSTVWYLNPTDSKRYSIRNSFEAWQIMKKLGLGISNRDYNILRTNGAPRRLAGRIIIKVEDLGKAYYINPKSLNLHYLGRPSDAFSLFTRLGVGISNSELEQVPIEIIR